MITDFAFLQHSKNNTNTIFLFLIDNSYENNQKTNNFILLQVQFSQKNQVYNRNIIVGILIREKK
jgi:hypothetical protein